MKILSLFDGISCARIALERAGFEVEKYYASETDKYAIQIAQKNYPDTIQLGNITKLKGKVLHLSGVYDILKSYDNNIQNKLSKREMLYWLNKDFSISAKIGTQITNGNTSKSTLIQRIEEIRFSKSGVGDIVKTQELIGSRRSGENSYIQRQEPILQCGEWRYVYRSNTGDKAENITGTYGQKTKSGKYRKNQTSSTQTMVATTGTKETIGTDKERNVGESEQTKISKGIKKSQEWCSETFRNRVEKARSYVQKVSFPLPAKDDDESITEREWYQLSIHKEMETTVVENGKSVDIFLGTFDIFCGGSPCQDLSIAKKNRKGLKGERSGLFWEYVRILKEVKPKYFILENVASMSKADKAIITETLGVEPITINAALVSAQNRKRLFWTNIKGVEQPKDKEIYLKDILESKVDEKYFSSEQAIKNNHRVIGNLKELNEKARALTATMWKGDGNNGTTTIRVGQIGKGGQGDRIYSPKGKSVSLSANGGGRGAKTGLYEIKPVALRNRGQGKKPEYNKTNKANTLTTVQTDSMVDENTIVRKLTPTECERLQCVPDQYTGGISNTQRYKCLGNAFNVDVIVHILKSIK